MNFNEESTKIKLWLSVGFRNKSDVLGHDSERRNTNFTFAGIQKKLFEGMISKDIEEQIERKTLLISDTINSIERGIQEDSHVDIILEEDEEAKEDKEKGLLEGYD
mmetsp:Transcript_11598/g.11541  ORF Transcript_11598/g.11541 Transcript_11598/m.11541 type:complete len:106 (+) Transcript_11598:1219-1536(+)